MENNINKISWPQNLGAVIFDMDGVLVDSEPHHTLIEQRLFRQFGLPISEAEHATYMGTSTREMWEDINKKYQAGLNVDETVNLNYQTSYEHFSSLENFGPMPGLIEVLEFLQNQNIPMAVASSSDIKFIEIILSKTGIKPYFQQLVSSSMVAKSKPEPDIFLLAAKSLQTKPEHCLIIEDSSNGIKAAQAAGIYCLAYTGAASSKRTNLSAEIIIKHYKEFIPLLQRFNHLK